MIGWTKKVHICI